MTDSFYHPEKIIFVIQRHLVRFFPVQKVTF